MTTPVERVIRAWNDKGPRPDLHESAQAALRREWPALGAALDTLTVQAVVEHGNLDEARHFPMPSEQDVPISPGLRRIRDLERADNALAQAERSPAGSTAQTAWATLALAYFASAEAHR